MKGSLFLSAYYGDIAIFLITAIVMVWQKQNTGQIKMVRANGVSLAVIPIIYAIQTKQISMIFLAVVILVVRAGITPSLIARAFSQDNSTIQIKRSVNSTAALLAAGVSVLVGYLIANSTVALDPTAVVSALPVPFGVILISVILLVTARHMSNVLVAFLLLDNGISAVGFVLTRGIPPIVELGALIDIAFLVFVLALLAGKLRIHIDDMDIDKLRELHE